MDPIRNPFAPGAGSQPPELAGRDGILTDARTALQRALLGRSAQSQMLLGLRGVGKTVLLNKIEDEAKALGWMTTLIEAPEGRPLAATLSPRMAQVLRRLSTVEAARTAAQSALRALRAFASAFKIKIGDLGVGIEPDPGIADSGTLEYDLPDLFERIGEAARDGGRGWALLIDEVQYLTQEELSALIVALHRVAQKGLPILFWGAGLPNVAALSGEAKSYAERLFLFPGVGPLPAEAARAAIRRPLAQEGQSITDAALAMILSRTEGYPYFLQEWGFQAWNAAPGSPIAEQHVQAATEAALRRLDEGFFRVRFDRLTQRERDYVRAMSRLGDGPYRSADVAQAMGGTLSGLSPLRDQIIRKGMIYSPEQGVLAFTVPMFDDYLRRIWP